MSVSAAVILRTLLSVVVVTWLSYYLLVHWDIFQASFDASAGQVGAIAACVLVTWILNSLQVLSLLRLEGIKVTFWENFFVQCATQLGNYLPMRMGTILRFRYFKRIHRLEYTRLGGIAALRLVILVTATGLLAIIGLLGLRLSSEASVNNLLWFVFVGMAATPIVGWYLAVRHLRLPHGLVGDFLKRFLAAFTSITARPRLAGFVMVLLVGQFAMLSVRLYISFDAMQVQLSPWFLIMLAPTATLLAILTVTPGNLGLREWIIGVLSVAAGYRFDSAVFAGMVDRAVLMGCTFVFGSFGLAFLLVRLSKSKHDRKVDLG